ncbi:MAG: MarR family winged helix-turn-helix transcriptional regulator [Candidatus Binatia bacterium]
MRSKSKQTAIEFMARECVGNQLRMLNRVVTGIYEDEFRPLRLTASQMIILALTAKHNQVRAAELCRWLQIDASTLSRNIDRMRANGWLSQATTEDQRSRPFQLTADGEKILHDAILAWERAQVKAVRLLGKEGVALLKTVTKNVKGSRSAN